MICDTVTNSGKKYVDVNHARIKEDRDGGWNDVTSKTFQCLRECIRR